MPIQRISEVIARAVETDQEQSCDVPTGLIDGEIDLIRIIVAAQNLDLEVWMIGAPQVLAQYHLIANGEFCHAPVYEGSAEEGCLRFMVRPKPKLLS